MTKRKLALVMGVLALVTILGVVSVGAAFAQTGTPPSQSTPNQAAPNQQNNGKLGKGFGFGFGLRGGDMTTFDAIAKALGLDPTELFNQLHSGKSLNDIATAQGKTLADVQAAVNASRVQAMKDKIAQAVTDGTITQDQANWLLQGLDKGYFGGGHGMFGFGFGGRGHGNRGMMMPGFRGNGGNGTQQPAPSTSSFGTSS
jgi:hypothetical protein